MIIGITDDKCSLDIGNDRDSSKAWKTIKIVEA